MRANTFVDPSFLIFKNPIPWENFSNELIELIDVVSNSDVLSLILTNDSISSLFSSPPFNGVSDEILNPTFLQEVLVEFLSNEDYQLSKIDLSRSCVFTNKILNENFNNIIASVCPQRKAIDSEYILLTKYNKKNYSDFEKLSCLDDNCSFSPNQFEYNIWNLKSLKENGFFQKSNIENKVRKLYLCSDEYFECIENGDHHTSFPKKVTSLSDIPSYEKEIIKKWNKIFDIKKLNFCDLKSSISSTIDERSLSKIVLDTSNMSDSNTIVFKGIFKHKRYKEFNGRVVSITTSMKRGKVLLEYLEVNEIEVLNEDEVDKLIELLKE